jgi:hypothetical protein
MMSPPIRSSAAWFHAGFINELTGSAYSIVAGVDGRTHHLRFSEIEMTGGSPTGAIVEARVYDGADGRRRVSLATLSELSICEQVTAKGTLLDRQLLAKDTLRERYFRSQQRASRAFF